MAIKHLAGAFDLDWHFDNSSQRHVYLELAYWTDRKGVIRITQTEVASRCLLSLRTVAGEFKKLQELGLLKRLNHGRYALHFPTKEEQVDDEAMLKSQLQRWLEEEFTPNSIAKKSISLLDKTLEDIEEVPAFVHQAIEKGWLQKGQRVDWEGQGGNFYKIAIP